MDSNSSTSEARNGEALAGLDQNQMFLACRNPLLPLLGLLYLHCMPSAMHPVLELLRTENNVSDKTALHHGKGKCSIAPKTTMGVSEEPRSVSCMPTEWQWGTPFPLLKQAYPALG